MQEPRYLQAGAITDDADLDGSFRVFIQAEDGLCGWLDAVSVEFHQKLGKLWGGFAGALTDAWTNDAGPASNRYDGLTKADLSGAEAYFGTA